MKVTIELPETVEVSSRGRAAKVNVNKLTADMIAHLALHGLTQKVADAAAGAKGDTDATKADNGLALMQKVVKNLEAGNWGRVAAAHVMPVEIEVRRIVAALVKAKNAKVLTGLKGSDLAVKLDAIFAAQPEAKRAEILKIAEARVEEARKRAEKNATMASALELQL